MNRYLMFVGYIGTHFHGVARQRSAVRTVAGVIEDSIQVKLQPLNSVEVTTSSRTDLGVHALRNSLHFDLQHSECGRHFYPKTIHRKLCAKLAAAQISILEVHRVPVHFHCRFNAMMRQYAYRLLIPKEMTFQRHPFPVTELNRAFIVKYPLNIDVLNEVLELFSGRHDFQAFASGNSLKQQPTMNTVRDLQINLSKDHSTLDDCMDWYKDFDNYKITFTSKSFLNKQIRRMVGLAVAIACGQMKMSVVMDMLNAPEKYERLSSTKLETVSFCAPPHGLYLTDVQYHPTDLLFPNDENTQIVHNLPPAG